MNRLVSLKKDTMKTSEFEQHMEEVKTTIKRYREVEKSEELKAYYDLKKIVETPEFQQKKNFLLKRKYRETEEGKTMRAYRRARLFPSTRFYLSREQSQRKDSWLGKKLQAWRLSLGPVREYLRLDPIVKSEEFQERNEFWKNPRRWYTTPESKQDERLAELKKSEDIHFFLAQDPKQIEYYESYKTLWTDEMDWMMMKDGDWKPGFYYTNKNLKTDHSYFNEQQANNKGMNSAAVNSVLTVEVKPEFVGAAPAWHPTKGFVTKEYSYTGDVIQTANAFSTNEGLFLAKVRAEGKAHVALYLAAGDRLPLLTLMHWNGENVTMGMKTQKTESKATIEDLNAKNWMIYGLQITDKELIWSINGQEVNREANTLKDAKWYPAVSAYLPEGIKPSVGQIDIDWIRVYKQENKKK